MSVTDLSFALKEAWAKGQRDSVPSLHALCLSRRRAAAIPDCAWSITSLAQALVSQPAEPAGAPRSARGEIAVFLLICCLVLPLVLDLGMTKGLNHDEHQHVAAGALIAREGLLPYRDFPHFHTPYLAYVYAFLFRTTDHLLLAARLFSVACATGIAGLVGTIGWSLFRERGRGMAAAVSAGAVLLCLTSGVFALTTGRAWNQEPALFLTMLAFCAHLAGLRRQNGGWLMASGLLLGIAIGLRITVAPLVAPFGLAIVLFPTRRWNPRLILCFMVGLLVGTAGILVFFVIAPEQTFFGNFGFAKVNVDYRLGRGGARTMTLLTKFRFVWKEILRREVPLVLIAVLPLVALRIASRAPIFPKLRFELRFILLLLPFVFIGALAPSPLFSQYFYPIVPFLVLAGLYGLTALAADNRVFRCTIWAATAIVAVSMLLGRQAYSRIGGLLAPAEWTATQIHRQAGEMFAAVRPGRVLTLAPIYPLEAGWPIYAAFSTGPFAWRVAGFVETERAVRLGIVSPSTLDALIQREPPAAMLLGADPTSAGGFFEYARRYGYRPEGSVAGVNVWVPSSE